MKLNPAFLLVFLSASWFRWIRGEDNSVVWPLLFQLLAKRFCKHIGVLMLALPEEVARGVLLGIKREKWEFSQYTGRGIFY
jgi:hypothetical protein